MIVKVGEELNSAEDYCLWKLAHYFITEQEYRIIQVSNNEKEVWLEKRENKEAQVIRLLQHNIDWSNWLQQDLERTAENGEHIRKKVTRGELHVYNIYISAYPPVDDYQFLLDKPFVHQNNKSIVHSLLIEQGTYKEKLAEISQHFGSTINVNDEDFERTERIEKLKQVALETDSNRVNEERAMFDYGKPRFTYLFLAIQIILFILLEVSGGSTNTENLIAYGAKYNPLILDGEWWRFITPMFLHIGFLHLMMNSIALFYIGSTVERIFGSSRFLFLYLVAGFGGTLASFLFSSNVSAGASGAIFGCFGALLYFGLIYPKLFFRTMGMNIFILLAINLIFGFSMSGIDNAGHIGGLIGGFLATGIVHFPKRKKPLLQLLFFLLTITLSVGALRFGFSHPEALLDEQSILMMSSEYVQENKPTEAYELLKSIENEKVSAGYYFQLSYVEIQLEKYAEAKESLLKAIKEKPDFHEAHYNLAIVYIKLNDLENAKAYAAKAVKYNPGEKQYTDLLAELK